MEGQWRYHGVPTATVSKIMPGIPQKQAFHKYSSAAELKPLSEAKIGCRMDEVSDSDTVKYSDQVRNQVQSEEVTTLAS